MKTRSIDDIRNYWALKVAPILMSFGKKRKKIDTNDVLDQWTEADDINLLEGIEAQEVSD